MNYISLIFLIFLLTGCASNQEVHEKPKTPQVDVLSKMGVSELYIIFPRIKNGDLDKIDYATSNQVQVLNLFKNNVNLIKSSDCIRLAKNKETSSADNISATVCDKTMWFDYGENNLTQLTTRKSKDVGETAVGVLGAGLTLPFTVLIDALSFDPTLNSTRKTMTSFLSDPEQDFDALNKTKNDISQILTNQYLQDRREAKTSLDNAIIFASKYTNDDFYDVIEANFRNFVRLESLDSIFTLMTKFKVTKDQLDRSLSYLRGLNKFDGFSIAFDLSSDINDAKSAQSLASNQADKKKTEYMAIKLYRNKKGSLNDLFFIKSAQQLQNSGVNENRNLFGWFTESKNSGSTNFSATATVAADKKLGLFVYGTYDVTVKAVLSIRQRYYRNSFWLGNADVDEVKTFTNEKVVRLNPSFFAENVSINFNDVVLNYKDRGVAGGTTEITTIGNPTVKMEITNVTLRE